MGFPQPDWLRNVTFPSGVDKEGKPLAKGEQKKLDARKRRALGRCYKDLCQVGGGYGYGGTMNFKKGKNMDPVTDDEVSMALASALKWGQLGLTPAKTHEDFLERTELYFRETLEHSEYPLWEKYCLAIGYDSATVGYWLEGRYNQDPQVLALLKWSREIIKAFAGDLVEHGKIPPIPYIYRSKNFYDMVDQKQIVTRTETPLLEASSPEELQKKYLAASDDI